MFPWVDKVTTGTQSFVLVVLNFGTWFGALTATRILFSEHANWKVISQLS